MMQLKMGEFFGNTDQLLRLDGLTLTDTIYTYSYVDWHYHEHAYFTFIVQGEVLEGTRQELLRCSPGTLLYHRHQEPHYNIKPNMFTRDFHVRMHPVRISSMCAKYFECTLGAYLRRLKVEHSMPLLRET
ncbi:hypothetical protein [Mucilaginibacter mallensis]|nr:hypothetical protein [Mucilaginibacter mallensis]